MSNSDKHRPLDVSGEDTTPVTPTEQIVEPLEGGTADVLAAVPRKAKAPKKVTSVEKAGEAKKVRRMGAIRAARAVVPGYGDDTFDLVRKSTLLLAILVLVAAICLLLEDRVINPMLNSNAAASIRNTMYVNEGVTPVLNEAEQNFAYPPGLQDSFKKLYYQNQDTRGWLSFNSPDGTTIAVDYPVLWSGDNDYYLNHDFYQTYNKNGALFFDFRNQFSSPSDVNRNLIIYGHNMASGQMFACLNRLLYGVDYARLAPTFTMNTIYEEATYKVFAVMVVNSNQVDGTPFGYLRTSFSDDVDFANFLAEITARSLYVYGDVDLRPDDNILMMSTCNTSGEVHFTEGRTVVVARKVREGEDPTTDPNTIYYNNDVIMPYGWYKNQDVEPHPYYTDPNYYIPELPSLKPYLEELENMVQSGETLPNSQPGVTIPSITIPTTTTSTTVGTTATTKPEKKLYTITINTPLSYEVGESFDYKNTTVIGWYTNGERVAINPRHCAITGFNSSHPSRCHVTIHYGQLKQSFTVTIRRAGESPDVPSTTPTTPPDTTAPISPDTTATTVTEPTSPPEDAVSN